MMVEVSNKRSRERELARIYAALGEPTRVRIVQLLAQSDELSCGAIAEQLGLQPSTLSHHLGLLEDSGLIEVRKSGTHRLIRVDRAAVHRYAPAVI
jgi:DNA-binding transcriptional ArsR family regulator